MRGTVASMLLLVLAACQETPDTAGQASPTGIEAPSPMTPSPSPTTDPATEPTPVEPTHGGTFWAVYLATGVGSELEDEREYLRSRGLGDGAVSIQCDEGAEEALEALGADTNADAVGLYFATEPDARAWAETLPAPPLAIVEVRTFCLD